ncbi:MAG: carboxypeptidase regulatory-like domain-containing protein [Flavobacteriales bacterium]|nr:carboxypeptidase regulatory-like domain-containing protein [Flavobacteriales bacterium]
MKRILVVISVLCLSVQGFSQSGNGSVKGVLTDAETGEPIPFANIVIQRGGDFVAGSATDFNGEYNIKAIPVGTYDIIAKYIGFSPLKMTGIRVSTGIQVYDLKLSSGIQMEEFKIVVYTKPLIDIKGGSVQTMTGDEIKKMPGRGVESAALMAGGVVSTDGEIESIRGARSDATVYYIDGIKVIGSIELPQSAIDQVEVILGGLPPMYGDATGGVISVTTKGASSEFFGSIEFMSRVAAHNYWDFNSSNMVSFMAGGPLVQLKDKAKIAKAVADGENTGSLDMKKYKKPFISYMVSSQIYHQPNYGYQGGSLYRAKDDVIERLDQAPLVLQAEGTAMSAEYLRASDFEPINKAKERGYSGSISGNFNVNTSKKTTLKFGGSFAYDVSSEMQRDQLMFNSDAPRTLNNDITWRVFGKFTHRLSPDSASLALKPDSSRLFKNVNYTIQGDYTMQKVSVMNEKFRDDYFSYGHIGSFKTHRAPTYERETRAFASLDGSGDSVYVNARMHNAYKDTLYEFTPGESNPQLAAYTSQYYNFHGDNVVDNYQNRLQVQQGGGLINGDQPEYIAGIYPARGTVYGAYAWDSGARKYYTYSGFEKSEYSQMRFTGNVSVDIGKKISTAHAVSMGFEYEKRPYRSFFVSPMGLWQIMRDRANFHIQQLDLNSPNYVFALDQNGDYALNSVGDPILVDTVNFDRINNTSVQNYFDYNLREKIGAGDLEMLNIDEYDPDTYSLDMFSPDELFNGSTANAAVGYIGYDHTGEKTNKRSTVDDFFNAKDDFGNFKREIPVQEPIYSAFYIQDEFAFRDLFFTAGIRVDRYDNNQQVLKDKYSLYNIREVNDLTNDELGDIPSNIGGDYKVYVNDYKNPERIQGFRDGDVWYNASGIELNSFEQVKSSTGINPYFVEDASVIESNGINSSAFEDYVPQVKVSPRLSFSFPISDEALFFAHYDRLVQRPMSSNGADYMQYLFLKSVTDAEIENPNLKQEMTIDYELGFQTKLSNKSALKFTAYYREMRDQLNAGVVNGAFPNTYYTTRNIDFSTVKGGTIGYDLRKIGNTGISGSVNYTLQFADGTGSSSEDGLKLLRAGFAGNRFLIPLDFDRRHAISIGADYRTEWSDEYTGWVIGGPKPEKEPKEKKEKKKKKNSEVDEVVIEDSTDEVVEVVEEDEEPGVGFQVFANSGINLKVVGGSGQPYSLERRATATQTGASSSSLLGDINGARYPWRFTVDVTFSREFEFGLGWRGEDHKKGARDGAWIEGYFEIICFNILNLKYPSTLHNFTGNSNDDGYLASAQAELVIAEMLDPDSFVDYYQTSMKDPSAYMSPRLIQVGVSFAF